MPANEPIWPRAVLQKIGDFLTPLKRRKFISSKAAQSAKGYNPAAVRFALNRRHKAGLFVALSATGLSLILELSAKQTIGIALLGISVAWFLGSSSVRTLGLISCLLVSTTGLYVATSPVWKDWESVRESAGEYDSAIAALSDAVRNTPVPREQIDISAGLVPKVDHDALARKYGGTSQKDSRTRAEDVIQQGIADALGRTSAVPPPPPGFILQRTVEIPEVALKWARGVNGGGWTTVTVDFPAEMSDAEIIAELKKTLRPRPSFTLSAELRSHFWSFIAGLGLLLSGLLGYVWVLRRGHTDGIGHESS